MAELIDKWDVVSKLISLENEYQFFKGSEFALNAEKLYRRICEMEIGIGKTQGTEVVRCKGCKYCETFYPEKEIGKEARQVWYCKLYKFSRKPEEFCSDGERKDNEY